MPQHIPYYENNNQPIVGAENDTVPLCYFNIIKLQQGQVHTYTLENHESVCVMASGTCDFKVGSQAFHQVGQRPSIWEGNPDSVYIPKGVQVTLTGQSEHAEIFVAGGLSDEIYEPFRVSPAEVELIQYGSDDTKTHRQIKHVLGKNAEGRAGRLLVSELFTVGAGGWSGFPPHKHDEDRYPEETLFEEVYQFRFNPEQGFGAQFVLPTDDAEGPVYQVKNGSTVLIDKGYHPVVAAPGYQMYYFTIIVGKTHRALIQHFHPAHEYQVHTIPGIKDMIKGFK